MPNFISKLLKSVFSIMYTHAKYLVIVLTVAILPRAPIQQKITLQQR